MLDLEIIRQSPEKVKESIQKRFGEPKIVDDFLALDQQWRDQLGHLEELRAERNQLTKTAESAREHIEQLKRLKTDLETANHHFSQMAQKRQELYQQIPNLVADDVPVGEADSANRILRQEGEIRIKEGQPHDILMTKLDWLDLTQAAQISGSRFRYLKNQAALAHLKLMHTALAHAISKGFTPVIPPVIARGETLARAGFFPFGREEIFELGEDRFLSGTSEPMLIGLAANQKFLKESLPLRLVGFSTCFRKEAGSYGKDVQGMFRQHQFDKVEMIVVCTPEQAAKEHELLVQTQEELVQKFNLPYQVVLIGSGDLSPKEYRKIDLETWFPGQGRYRETHSASTCTDFQARSFGVKYQDDSQEGVAHILNATLATERLLLAIIENNQTPDGLVNLPEELQHLS